MKVLALPHIHPIPSWAIKPQVLFPPEFLRTAQGPEFTQLLKSRLPNVNHQSHRLQLPADPGDLSWNGARQLCITMQLETISAAAFTHYVTKGKQATFRTWIYNDYTELITHIRTPLVSGVPPPPFDMNFEAKLCTYSYSTNLPISQHYLPSPPNKNSCSCLKNAVRFPAKVYLEQQRQHPKANEVLVSRRSCRKKRGHL